MSKKAVIAMMVMMLITMATMRPVWDPCAVGDDGGGTSSGRTFATCGTRGGLDVGRGFEGELSAAAIVHGAGVLGELGTAEEVLKGTSAGGAGVGLTR
ncbi:hypothetical protein [Chondromyces crocatus]|uniref:hypothetical protein n=1 Tax=Chondromyces crocatus TaxID=52 RepID=UPI0012E10B72|nr:hypothetical protein [Chondromyces crocatus]